MLIAVSRS